MKDEVNAAVDFLARLVAKNESLKGEKVEEFRSKLTTVLMSKYKNHWFPDKPSRGQAFRCIRINENIRQDTLLVLVCQDIGINYSDLKMPVELTLWIDPEEVTCRFGEHKGSYCVIASFRDGNKENYVDQINVDELEKKSVERSRQASFDLVKSAKRRANLNNLKNQAAAAAAQAQAAAAAQAMSCGYSLGNGINGGSSGMSMTSGSNGMMMAGNGSIGFTNLNGLFRPNAATFNGSGLYSSPPSATTYYSNGGGSGSSSRTPTANGGHSSHSRGPFYSPARSSANGNSGGSGTSGGNNLMNRWSRPDFNVPTIN